MSREFRFFCVIWAMASCLFADDSAAAASGTFVDGRDGRSYRFVVIGEQTWMAENLNFGTKIPLAENQGAATSSSARKYCPGDSAALCESLGALYQWHSAMAFAGDCDRYPLGCEAKIGSPHRGICPEGWHVPTREEWMKLQRFAEAKTGTDADSVGGTLKSRTGWRQIVEGPSRGVRVPKAKQKCHGCDGGPRRSKSAMGATGACSRETEPTFSALPRFRREGDMTTIRACRTSREPRVFGGRPPQWPAKPPDRAEYRAEDYKLKTTLFMKFPKTGRWARLFAA